ncbi:SusC/RagA family TonB-linked outer membrane protein [Spirosoma utsteinense]|uniref:TonB-linked SusC/RagA family outer membrane protein n=1 Tax=Spirosoma utsteinense TaxID=2585773 RepID=A0ABR6W763_9BACT|nr:TonB-dependent receptor [Spirosoma utsteinense]MBC3786143.1 TonB-linked SusC/RagA family outer membrane protein [Spirosoma utsteinense]MBC3792332.1 TonB-linked SusC/RagA family outer membrane protein [Spirosoma utsteinense]
MSKHIRIILPLLFLLAQMSYAQTQAITGRVTSSDDNAGLPGVSVSVKGRTLGTQTDATGNFTLNVGSDATLVFSFIGFSSVEERVGNRSVINVKLQADVRNLNEVVVTGYGQQIKRELTGNIAKIRSSDIQDQPVTTFDQALQGKAAGVQVNSGSGKLGQGIQVRVRGQSSVSASNQPLYVVDGTPVTTDDLSINDATTNPLSDINPQDIESIEILKDASAGAIYGSRAANGVVLITTKKGRSGRTNVTFGIQAGSSTPTRKLEFLNTNQYVDFYRQAAANSDRIDGLATNDPDSYTTYMENFFQTQGLGTFGTPQQANTNWGDLGYQAAPFQQYDMNINGGNDKTTFYLSGQLLDQKGILIGNALTRYSGRINLDHKISDRFRVGFNTGLSRTLNKRLSGDRQFDNPVQMVALPPMTPSTDPTTGLPVGTPPGDISIPSYYNPIINLQNSIFNTTVYRNISNVYGQLGIVKGLTFRTEFGLDVLNQQEERYYNSKTQRNTGYPGGLGQFRTVRVENYTTNNFFNYNTTVGRHGLDGVLGMSYQQAEQRSSLAEGQDFPSDAYRMIISAARKTNATSTQSNYSFLSYFVRANYKFTDRYLLGLSARVDGSSRFGQDSRYGFFPAVSAGWVLTEESFLKNTRGISFLKLRASYGRTGNAEIDNFPQLGLFTGDASYAGLPGQRPTQLANPSLKWETTDQADIGLDFGFLNNRLNGEIDYYNKQTTGLLLNVNVPGSTGFATQFRNVGSLENKGFEFVLNTENTTGAFRWTTSLNAATNRNRIKNLQGQIIEGGLNAMSRAVEGQPLGVFFTPEYAGVDAANGDALWYKNATNTDGSIDRATTNVYNEAQRVVVGSPLPKWTGGVTNTFSYKGFSLSVFFTGVFGNDINFYGVGRFSSANGRFEDNQTVNQLAAWTAQNTNTDVPEARLFFNNGAQPSSRFILDGSFVRLRNATLAYNLPKTLINRVKLNTVRVFVTGLNLLTFTKYAGWDPEVNADDVVTNIAQGYDFYTAPQARTITGGINIGF